jgi:hypothetical protein
MPAEESVRRDDRADLAEQLPSKSLPLGRQAAALVVVEPELSRAEVLAEYPVLVSQVLDDALLPLAEDTGDEDTQELPGSHHGRSHQMSVSINEARTRPATGCSEPAKCLRRRHLPSG